MQHMGQEGESCPFSFNIDATTFRVGYTVSYCVSTMDGFPFAG